MEISCDGEGCSTAEAFTPMSIAFNDDGEMYLCMYSGCWEGRGQVMQTAGFLSIAGADLTWSTDPERRSSRQSAAVVLDLHDSIAVMKVGTYAQPLVCEVLKED